MEIILIRHAKAEERLGSSQDIKRHLTEKGKQKFRQLMPELNEKLEPIEEGPVLLWSSPATRALETAQIVAEELQMEINAIHDFLYEGDFEKFSQEILNLNEDTTLVIVGHEPTLSEWTKRMAGEDVKIRKGEILNFHLHSRSPLEAELRWVIKPE